MQPTHSNATSDRPFLTADELAGRYSGKVSVKTLANWRSTGAGPAYTKIGGRVFYAVNDVMHWEARRQITPSASK